MNEAATMMAEVSQIDPREIRSRKERDSEQARRLRSVVEAARSQPYYEDVLAGIDPVETPADLVNLPILRKNDLIDIQPRQMPFGGIMADSSQADYLFISPGPILEPGFIKQEFWRVDRAMRAAGFSSSDVIHNTFSYHLTPGAWMMDSGARSMGCSVIPAGNAPIEQQIMAIYAYGATAYAGTPDFLKTLMEACLSADRGPLPFKRALVSGGALTPGLRDFFSESGVRVLQCYATAELGLIAYEADTSGHMFVDEDLIVEIIDPTNGQPMPFGEVGEVVVTTLREDYPLVRFGTGDLSAFVEKVPVDGRTGMALAGWLGRADQAAKGRGMFVRPSQIVSLCGQVKGLQKARLVIDRENEKDDIMLFCEWDHDVAAAEQGKSEVERAFRELCHLRTKVTFVDDGTLADDGKVIVDMR